MSGTLLMDACRAENERNAQYHDFRTSLCPYTTVASLPAVYGVDYWSARKGGGRDTEVVSRASPRTSAVSFPWGL